VRVQSRFSSLKDPFPPERALSCILARGREERREKEFPRGGIHKRDGTRTAGFWLSVVRSVRNESSKRQREFVGNLLVRLHLQEFVPPSDVTSGAGPRRRTEVTCGQRNAPPDEARYRRGARAGGQWARRGYSGAASRRCLAGDSLQSCRDRRSASVGTCCSEELDLATSYLPHLSCVNARFRSGRLPNSKTMACNRAAKSGFAAEAQRKVRVAREMDQMDPADPFFSPRAPGASLVLLPP